MVIKEINSIEELERIKSALDIDNSLLWNLHTEIFENYFVPMTNSEASESFIGSS